MGKWESECELGRVATMSMGKCVQNRLDRSPMHAGGRVDDEGEGRAVSFDGKKG